MPPLISVLLPSRGRPAALARTVAGLFTLAADPAGVQVLVAADPDDPALDEMTTAMSFHHQVRVRVAPERYGYACLHWYLNALAGQAAGQWLMMWNDDCSMLTPRWDEVICGEGPGVLWPQADYAPEINTFPVVPSAWVRHLGHVSLDQSADMWWHDLGERTGTLRKIPVCISHEHRCGDRTAAERDAVATVATFHAPAMAAARETDAAKLREMLASGSAT